MDKEILTELDVEKIDFMIELFFDLLRDDIMDKNRISYGKMVKELLDLKFKYLGVGKRDDEVERADEKAIRKRLMESGLNLKEKTKKNE